MIVVEEHTHVGAPVIKVFTPLGGDTLTGTRRVIEFRVTESNVKPFEVVLEHGVHYTSHRISTVNGRSTVAKNFNTIDTPHRQVVRVCRIDGNKTAAHFLGLVGS